MNRNTIVNHILTTLGESGVSALDTTHPSVQAAKEILTVQDIDFQGRGWWFNTEYRLKLLPNTSGRVVIPNNTLEMFISDVPNLQAAEKLRYVRRGQYIYDTFNHTDVLNKSIYVDIVLQQEIEDLPSVAASYLMHKSAEVAYVADDGDQFKTDELKELRMEAWQRLQAVKMKTLAVNALDNPMNRALQYRIGRITTPLLGGGQR